MLSCINYHLCWRGLWIRLSQCQFICHQIRLVRLKMLSRENLTVVMRSVINKNRRQFTQIILSWRGLPNLTPKLGAHMSSMTKTFFAFTEKFSSSTGQENTHFPSWTWQFKQSNSGPLKCECIMQGQNVSILRPLREDFVHSAGLSCEFQSTARGKNELCVCMWSLLYIFHYCHWGSSRWL